MDASLFKIEENYLRKLFDSSVKREKTTKFQLSLSDELKQYRYRVLILGPTELFTGVRKVQNVFE